MTFQSRCFRTHLIISRATYNHVTCYVSNFFLLFTKSYPCLQLIYRLISKDNDSRTVVNIL